MAIRRRNRFSNQEEKTGRSLLFVVVRSKSSGVLAGHGRATESRDVLSVEMNKRLLRSRGKRGRMSPPLIDGVRVDLALHGATTPPGQCARMASHTRNQSSQSRLDRLPSCSSPCRTLSCVAELSDADRLTRQLGHVQHYIGPSFFLLL